MSDSAHRYLPALDGLRGVAIAGVLLFHAGLLPGGFLGVDLFFTLSGYVITDLLLREGRVSLAGFWGRRVRRLLPALFVMLATVTLIVYATASADLVRTTLSDGPWVQANLVNWHLIAESAGYWDRFGPGRVFEHLWSIAVEEQFYIVWPVVVALCHRRPAAVTVTAALSAVASLVLMVALLDPADSTRVYTGTDTRAFSLLLGALTATAAGRRALQRIPDRWTGRALTIVAFALFGAWLVVDEQSPWLFTGGLFAHALASALLVGLCVRRPAVAVLSGEPLRRLGMISYSLYLWHWPLIVLLGPDHRVLACVASIVPAVASKYLIEDPIRYRARWARGRTGTVAATAAMAGLVALWVALPAPATPAIDVTDLT